MTYASEELILISVPSFFVFGCSLMLTELINITPLQEWGIYEDARSYLVPSSVAVLLGSTSLVDIRPHSLRSGMRLIARQVTALGMFLFLYHQVYSLPLSEFHLPVMLGIQLLTPLIFSHF